MSPDSSKYKLGRLENLGRLGNVGGLGICLLYISSCHIIAAHFTISPTQQPQTQYQVLQRLTEDAAVPSYGFVD
jgi:hypothetical protein